MWRPSWTQPHYDDAANRRYNDKNLHDCKLSEGPSQDLILWLTKRDEEWPSQRAWIITTKQTFIMISMVHAWDPLQEIKIETVNSIIEMWKQFVLSNYRHSSSGLKVRFSCATVVLTSCFDQIEKLEHVAQFNLFMLSRKHTEMMCFHFTCRSPR